MGCKKSWESLAKAQREIILTQHSLPNPLAGFSQKDVAENWPKFKRKKKLKYIKKCTRTTYNQICVGYKRIFCKFKETLEFSLILNLKNTYFFRFNAPPHKYIFSKIIEFKLPVKILCFSLLKCYNKTSWIENLELPWCLSGKESTCQRRGHGFNPRSGMIAHAMGQLDLCATLLSLFSGARGPQLLGSHAATPESHAP